jgi:1-acyl-sn-glycerol-3-phosphate acyltransferase
MDMLDAAAAALQNGQTLIIFPEGTRTTRSGAGLSSGAPIALRGAKILTQWSSRSARPP